ncbi:aminoglycoside phosphotransferase family protein [Arthrobacter cheniae]|uniref:Aminoglycoside phosphotransferase family protein n=1 Tax=Arthrobacter cheniae TaxID=1258888 RepID=A0A3A5M4C5_9MICC|nr:aminoglycoside phosphotransferase family protein [Arthrobacter cheniae]
MRVRDARIMREQGTIALLASDAPRELLSRALGAAGWELVSWQPASIHHRPGAGVTGVFPIEVRAVSGMPARRRPTAGEPPPRYACITSCALQHPSDGVVVVPGYGADVLSVWMHPKDPLLPGLPLALDPERVTAFAFGPGHEPGDTVLDLLSYRPLRRAVVLARNGEDRRYLKVLRPDAAVSLAERHRLLEAAGVPAPVLDGDPVQDVVAMRPARGRPLAELLMADGAADVDPRDVVRVLTSLPSAVLALPVRPPWSARVRDYGEAAVAALPVEADHIRRLAAEIDDAVRSSDAGPLVPTHGDFYEGNLLIQDGAVSGLLDVDALGPGHLVDDLACFLGHLAVLPGLHAGYTHVPEALRRFTAGFDHFVDPVALRSRAAAVSLTLIAGARRRAEHDGGDNEAISRLQVAERFLAEARVLGGFRRKGIVQGRSGA